MDEKYDTVPYDPNRTQKIKVEIERVGETDKHRSYELLMHIIDNLEAGIAENRGSIDAVQQRAGVSLNAHEVNHAHISEDRIKNLIAGALAVDVQARRAAAKSHYGSIFLKFIAPALLSGGALSELGHILGWLAHHAAHP